MYIIISYNVYIYIYIYIYINIIVINVYHVKFVNGVIMVKQLMGSDMDGIITRIITRNV